jgi:ADP-heptose:LPS heptosyltransferase
VNTATLRKIDQWVGVPLCAALTAVRRLRRLLHAEKQYPLGKILFVKLAEQGSTVLAAEALEYAAQLVGRENLFFLVFEENRFIADALGIIPAENVVVVRHKGVFALVASGFQALRKLWVSKIDAAVDFEFFSRASAVATFLSGATRRAGFHSYAGEGPYRGNLLTHRVIYNPYLHTSRSFLSLVQILAGPAGSLPAAPLTATPANTKLKPFVPGHEETAAIKRLLASKLSSKSANSPLILLNANCSDMLPLRRWPPERYALLSKNLLARYPEVLIAFTGTVEEKLHVQELLHQIGDPRCFSVAGDTTLRDLLTLYTIAEVLVSNDSGPAHFAALTEIDVVTLFGPETPALFGSLSARSHVLWAGIVCSPCVSALNNRVSLCQNNLCMQLLSVEQVFSEVCRVYESRCAERRIVSTGVRVLAGPGSN